MKHMPFKYCFYAIIGASFFLSSCSQRAYDNHVAFGDSLYLEKLPPQPGEDAWEFVEDMKSPMWTKHDWEPKAPGSGQADLSKGVTIKENFPDPLRRLETAYEDLNLFFDAGNVPSENGDYVIETLKTPGLEGEAFRFEVNPHGCRILAGGVEGIRRGIFHIEDEMLRLRGPFLSLGNVEKKTVVERRIARSFFGPIKRPPAMRDELMDNVDYYPDNYLNRLAHEGVNGLWLTIEFRDLAATSFTPEAGKDAARRLEKLRQTVAKNLRYGIQTYIFTIEPRAWDADSHIPDDYPEMAGHIRGNSHLFCPFSETAQQYLYESVNQIFSAVPDLGGIINITHGERATTCLSAVSSFSDYEGRIDCPRCSDKEPWEILYASLSAMQRGMHDVNPDSELISWLYMPQPQRYHIGDEYSLGDWVWDIPANTPEGVILQFNFESGVQREEFGKLLVGGDYWISNPGPSYRFERIANIARENATNVSAKIQTGTSHEVATVPFVPVPSLLHKKFDGMHHLGVSHTMLAWYFGNNPGLMLKASGLLSRELFPEDEDNFLHQLASIYWKEDDRSKVVEAWKHFSDGYENYPLTNLFQYYGPMHDGPVWPLLLRPADAPLSPTWQIGSSRTLQPWPPSGDRVGECIGGVMTLEETVELTRRITTSWDKGLEILTPLEKNYKNDPERILDIGVAKALGIQFRTGYNILNFYFLREKMLRMEGRERLDILKQLTDIIEEELELNKQLIKLCERDSRLGFHSEAEGYKYFPGKIEWRMGELRRVLENDVPALRKLIRNDELLFPEYTGKRPEGAVADCITTYDISWTDPDLPSGLKWYQMDYGAEESELQWAASRDSEAMYFWVKGKSQDDQNALLPEISNLRLKIEPQRLFPAKHFSFTRGQDADSDPVRNLGYALLYTSGLREINKEGLEYVVGRVPFSSLRLDTDNLHPIRIDVMAQQRGVGSSSWRPNNSTTPRLILGSDNPDDLGWLILENNK